MHRRVLQLLLLSFISVSPVAAFDFESSAPAIIREFSREYPEGLMTVCEHSQDGTSRCLSTVPTIDSVPAATNTESNDVALVRLATESNMYARVCPRVQNRFATDLRMWQRVNDRIERRFGFRCPQPDATFQNVLDALQVQDDAALSRLRDKYVDDAAERSRAFFAQLAPGCPEEASAIKERVVKVHNEYVTYLHKERDLASHTAKKNIEYLNRATERIMSEWDNLPRSCF